MTLEQALAAGATGWSVHPVFSRPRPGSLEALAHGDVREQWRHLAARVARDGLDLEAHVRRVQLASRAPLTELAFGALLDLFLALGPRGRALRERLLDQAQGWLEADELHFLRAHLEPGLSRGQALPDAPGSLLHDAVAGAARMVAHERLAAAEQSALEQAVSLLEHGDLDGARSLLEQALLDDPSDAGVSAELLGIYRHARDETARAAMAARLRERHATLPAGWTD